MHEKICVRCSHENREHFTYCKKCGALLPVVDRSFAPPPLFRDMSDPVLEPDTFQTEFDGADRRDMGTFIGKNSEHYLRKLDRMQSTGVSFSWCVPVFLLGLFFGLFGVSAWFFFRKLNKHGIIFTIAAILFMVLGGGLTVWLPSILSGQSALLQDLLVAVVFTAPVAVFSLALHLALTYPAFGILLVVTNLLIPAVAALSAVNVYKKRAVSLIAEVNELYPENKHLVWFALSKIGGRSLIPAVIPLIAFAVTMTAIIVLMSL